MANTRGSGARGGTGAATAGGAAATVAAIPPAPGPFSLHPSGATAGVLDYSDSAHVKIYKAATAQLEPKFGLEQESLRLFIESFKNRATVSNWTNTLKIECVRNGATTELYLPDSYGELTYEEIKAHTDAYRGGAETRDAQNSAQIMECLTNTLTKTAKQRIALMSTRYNINNEADGLLFFKVIVELTIVDTRATTTTIRNKLTMLPSKMDKLDDDVTKFNEYVQSLSDALNARGEKIDDLVVKLFAAYSTVSDKNFRQYIDSKENQYNEGADFEANELMNLARNKYETLLEAGKWKEETEEQKKIIALTAQLEQLKKVTIKSNKGKDKKHDGKNKSGKNTPTKGDKIPWYLTPPKDGKKSIQKNDKTYYWCPNHGKEGKWVRHKPEECKAKTENNKDTAADNKTKEEAKLKVANLALELDSDDDF